ncbi:hypothetical protein [Estrella lausannensis]|uniref:Uncharacterized protein n=1 Tax=Estrella lausannensis TaxID=483423 RepID=A0A0H5DNT3_9BACT|nr:hypothetical protein [Estrella lausannensis]CRX37957.1 hypothetical protein ELAC_0602 [Estrella lausannensis]
MPVIKIINDSSEITPGKGWVSAAKFNSKDRLVDEKGRQIDSNYQGRQYRIIEKRERPFSALERFERGCLGVALVIFTLCLAIFSRSVRELFAKSSENIRFAVQVSEGNLRSPQQREPTPISPEAGDASVRLESVELSAPWDMGEEPRVLPAGWLKHLAEQNISVLYSGTEVTIPRGDNYFTYEGKVAVGWHGTYNPPGGM